MEILFLITAGNFSQPKIRIMTTAVVTVLLPSKEPGGTTPVTSPT